MPFKSARTATALLTAGFFVGVLAATHQKEAAAATNALPYRSSAVGASDALRALRFAGEIRDLGIAVPNESVEFSVILHHQNADSLPAFAASVNDPKSPLYHKFLTTQQYESDFAPSRSEEASVLALLQRDGFTIVTRMPDRALITASGTIAEVDAAFGTQMHHLVWAGDPNPRLASMLSPVIPAAMASMVDDIVGLNDIVSPQPMSHLVPIAQHTNPQKALSVKPFSLGGQLQGRMAAMARQNFNSPLITLANLTISAVGSSSEL